MRIMRDAVEEKLKKDCPTFIYSCKLSSICFVLNNDPNRYVYTYNIILFAGISQDAPIWFQQGSNVKVIEMIKGGRYTDMQRNAGFDGLYSLDNVR